MKKKSDIEKAFSVIFGTWGSFCYFEFRVMERLEDKWDPRDGGALAISKLVGKK